MALPSSEPSNAESLRYFAIAADEDHPKERAREAKGNGKSTGAVSPSAHFISFDADNATVSVDADASSLAAADEDDPKERAREPKEAKGKGKSTGFVPSSAHFVSFNADDATEQKKRKAAEGADAEAKNAKAKKSAKAKAAESESDEIEEDQNPASSKKWPTKDKKAGGKGKKK